MLDDEGGSTASSTKTTTTGAASAPDTRRRAVSRPAGPPAATTFSAAETPDKPAKRATRKKTPATPDDTAANDSAADKPATKKAPARKQPAKKASAKKATAENATAENATAENATAENATAENATAENATAETTETTEAATEKAPADQPAASPFAAPLFQAPAPARTAPKKRPVAPEEPSEAPTDGPDDDGGSESDDDADDGSGSRRRRRRGGRRRRRGGEDDEGDSDGSPSAGGTADDSPASAKGSRDKAADDKPSGGKPAGDKPADGKGRAGAKDGSEPADSDKGGSGDDKSDDGKPTRRRRRRRRRGEDPGGANDDPENTVTKVRERRNAEDEISSVSGSTRLEAKKQRRREGREAGRRRAPIVTEAEFLARRESVKREMVIRQKPDLSQIAVLEDDVLVEHYVARESQTSMIGNVYLGRVQNVLPSMEAAFIDIGKGRNGVLYAGEVDWKALGDGKPRKIEEALKSGQTVLVQVTKDPVGHKGARLTSQISLAGRFLVYVPGGQTNGISRKLPDTERNRLKGLLKEILPDEAGVIIRTAAEGATEEQLNRDASGLTARWDDIAKKSEGGSAPQLLYGEPDLMIKVVRDLFNEDFAKLTVEGDTAWDMIEGYVQHVAPDLADRLEHWSGGDGRDVFGAHRIDEQISKAVDRKVWLPSGGSLIIDRTEAMTVVDVNTGKFTGSGGNLEETVTKNNLEAAEEIVRQLRLRDIGGIIVIDFIDMVLENNRDLVLRRLVECLGRDRTRHQVAEVTSLGLVQMTRKRIGTGLVEAFSESCEHCHGRGLIVHNEPVERKAQSDDSGRGRRRGGKSRGDDDKQGSKGPDKQSGKDADKQSGKQSGKDADKQPGKAADKQPGKDADKQSGKSPDKQSGKDADKQPGKDADQQPGKDVSATPEAGSGKRDEPGPDGVEQHPPPAPEGEEAPKSRPRSRRRGAKREQGAPSASTTPATGTGEATGATEAEGGEKPQANAEAGEERARESVAADVASGTT